MKIIVTKNGRTICTSTVPYSKELIKQIKDAGYKIKFEEKGKAESVPL